MFLSVTQLIVSSLICVAVFKLNCCMFLKIGQKVQASGSAAKEDSCHATQVKQARRKSEDQETAAKRTLVPYAEIRHQGIKLQCTESS